MLQVKKGDMVHVRAKVVDVHEHRASNRGGVIALEIDGGKVESYGDSIVRVEPRPLQAGDAVKLRVAENVTGTILAVHGDKVWVDVLGPGWSTLDTYRIAAWERA